MERNIYKIGKELFITSNEEIKEGDWVLDKFNQIWKLEDKKLIGFDSQGIKRFLTDNVLGHECKKIILTTDQDLIKDGVQAIGDEFIEWFVNNPSCEWVEVVSEKVDLGDLGHYEIYYKYKIIIPKEEESYERTTQSISLSEVDTQETLGQIPEKQENCCTPVGHIRRYKDCIGCDRKPKQPTLEEVPNKLDSVFAKITHQNDLGLSQWYEVVYYDIDNGKWCSYSGSKTFNDGEKVVEWKYCKELL